MKCPLEIRSLLAGRSGERRVLEYARRPSGGELGVHIRECPACTRLVRSQRALWSVLDEWELPPASQDFDCRVLRRVERAVAESFLERGLRACSAWLSRPALPLAAASLLILAGLSLNTPLRFMRPQPRFEAPLSVAPPEPLPSNAAEQIAEAIDDLQLLRQLDTSQDEAPSASNPI